MKSPRPEIFAQAGGQENFIREAETWVNLGLHPNIVSCYYVRNLANIPRIFAEYVAGGSLEDWINQGWLYEGGQEAALARILDVAIQFAWGLQFAHGQGLVHQDIKPHNVMMMPDGVAKVTDFGLARAGAIGAVTASSSGQSILVSSGGMTPAYCSPEQAAGKPLTRKTDLWSWGVSILEMFTGEVTWMAGQAAGEALADYLAMQPERTAIPRMPVELASLLGQCFALDPADRPANLQVIVDQLKDIYQAQTGRAYPRDLLGDIELRADSLNNRALSLLDIDKGPEARKAWEAAKKIDPLHLETSYNFGLWQWQTGEQPDDLELVQALEAAVMAKRGYWRAHYLLGTVHALRGDAESAARAFDEALQLSPGEIEVQTARDRLSEAQAGRCLQKFRYNQPMRAAAFSWDGRYAILAGGGGAHEDNSVLVWRVSSGSLAFRLAGHKYAVSQVCLTPDGEKLISADSHTIRVWSLETGACLQVMDGNDLDGMGKSLLLTPDGKQVIARGYTKDYEPLVRLWQIGTGRCVRTFRSKNEDLDTLAVTPDGGHILGGFNNGQICAWELRSGKITRTLEGHCEAITAIEVARDGMTVLSGDGGGSLRQWDWSTGQCRSVLTGHSSHVYEIKITPDGKRAVTRSGDHTVIAWDLESGCSIHRFGLHKEYVTALELTPDGKRALTASIDHTLRLLDLEQGRCLRTFVQRNEIRAMALSADGRLALAAESEPNLIQMVQPYEMYLWSLEGIAAKEAGLELSRPAETYQLRKLALAAREDLEAARRALELGQVTTAQEALMRVKALPGFERDPEWLALWRQVGRVNKQKKGLLFDQCILTIQHNREAIFTLACTQDGHYALAGGYGGGLKAWDLQNGVCFQELAGRSVNITGLGLVSADDRSPDSHLLVVRGYSLLELWDWKNNRLLATQTINSQLRLVVSPDGRWLVTSGLSQPELAVYQLLIAAGQERIEFDHSFEIPGMRSRENWFGCLACSPDGQVCAAGANDGSLVVWNPESGAHQVLILGGDDAVHAVVFTHDGQTLLSGHENGEIRAWQLFPALRCIKKWAAHPQALRSLAVTPDGRFAFSGGDDCVVRAWEISSGACLRTLTGHIDAVTALCVIDEGFRVVSGSADGTLRVWDLDWEMV